MARFHNLMRLILVVLILVNVLEFVGILDKILAMGSLVADYKFFKAILSITGLAYVLYRASLSDLFLGVKSTRFDLILLAGYLMLIVNKFVAFSLAYVDEANLVEPLLALITSNYVTLEELGFFAGGILLIIISIVAARSFKISKPSIMHALFGDEVNSKSTMTRFLGIFTILLTYYIIFFNLVIEWFTLVIDASLIVFAILLYMYELRNFRGVVESDQLLHKLLDFAENMLVQFEQLFHDRRTLLLGISGLLVLHVVTDVGAFVLPYSFGTESLYQQEIVEGEIAYPSIPELYGQDVEGQGVEYRLLMLLAYFLNTLGTIFLMIFPAFIWFIVYLNQVSEAHDIINFPSYLIAGFFSLLAIVVFAPVYKVVMADELGVIGVFITTQSPVAANIHLGGLIVISLVIFLMLLVLSKAAMIKEILFFLLTIISMGYFGRYIFLFFLSQAKFYLHSLILLFAQYGSVFDYFTTTFKILFFVLYLLVNVFFYIAGYASFVYTIFRSE